MKQITFLILKTVDNISQGDTKTVDNISQGISCGSRIFFRNVLAYIGPPVKRHLNGISLAV